MNGYKSYIVGVGMILVGAVGFIAHFIDPTSPIAMQPDAAKELVLLGLAMIAARSAVQKVIEKK